MSMRIASLNDIPDYFDKLISLIEESFGYLPTHSYKDDFKPLVKRANWKNIVLLLKGEELIATGGYRMLSLRGAQQEGPLDCAFVGGICTHVDYRGRGHGKQIMQELLRRLSNVPLIMLWSDNIKFYEGLAFKEAGFILENRGLDWCEHHQNLALSQSSKEDQEVIKTIYNSYYPRSLLVPERNEDDWQTIFQMNSVRYSLLKKDDQVWGYVFSRKGMDLTGLIHEAASLVGHEDLLKKELSAYSYWLRFRYDEKAASNTRYAGLMFKRQDLNEGSIFIPGVDSI